MAAAGGLAQWRMPARLMWRVGSPRTLLLAAFRAAQAFDDVIQASVPSAEFAERVRVGVAFMTALAFQNQRVLPELVTQLLDLEFARHAAIVAAVRSARPSSIRCVRVLYGRLSLNECVEMRCHSSRTTIGRGRWPFEAQTK